MNPADPPWAPGDTPEEAKARQEAYGRLADAARRIGVSLERLHSLLASVAANEIATRRFLSEEVYNVPDDLLDELIRVRTDDLQKRGDY